MIFWRGRNRLRAHLRAPNVLVVRNDGLGDFVLTLPLIASLKQQFPQSRITVLVQASLLPLIPLLEDIDGAIGDEGVLLKRHRGRFVGAVLLEKRRRLLEAVRAAQFDVALLPYAERESARLVHRAGIGVRVGPLRRPFFWRFNVHYRPSRKRSTSPEYALNLAYLQCLGARPEFRFPRLRLPRHRDDARRDPYAVMHPYKRSGTALTWPLENFIALARALRTAGYGVVIVGDSADRPLLEQHFAALAQTRLETGLTLPQLVGLIAGARLFVGNSSGPLHLAGLTRIPHVGFFPQNRVSAPERWRTLPNPRAPGEYRDYLLASRFPKGCVVCEGERCAYFNCVASIGQDAVWRGIQAWGLETATSIQ